MSIPNLISTKMTVVNLPRSNSTQALCILIILLPIRQDNLLHAMVDARWGVQFFVSTLFPGVIALGELMSIEVGAKLRLASDIAGREYSPVSGPIRTGLSGPTAPGV